MPDAKCLGYDEHDLLVYLETNNAAVAILNWIVRLEIQVALIKSMMEVVLKI